MKKLLLTGAALMALFSVSAQDVTSFETSEGFTVGNLLVQNGWGVSDTAGDESVQVSNAYASEGTNSLALFPENGAHTNLLGAFGPEVEPIEGNVISYAFDIYIPELLENGSDFFISTQSPSQELLTSRVRFTFDGAIGVVDYVPAGTTTLGYVDTNATFEAATWYHITVVQDNGADTVKYYVDDTLIYTGAAFGATNIEQFVALHDNYEGAAYIDNIELAEGNLAGVNTVLANKFSVSPNPANNLVTIANADNMLVNAVSVTDMNGRVVKTAAFDGVAQAQVNVSDLANGVYMMTISSDKGSVTKKIVKN